MRAAGRNACSGSVPSRQTGGVGLLGSGLIVEADGGEELADARVSRGDPADDDAEDRVEDEPLQPRLKLVEEEPDEGPYLRKGGRAEVAQPQARGGRRGRTYARGAGGTFGIYTEK